MGIRIYRKADYKAMKTQIKKSRSAAMVKIDNTHLRKKIAYRFKSVYSYNLSKRMVGCFFFALFIFIFFLFISTFVSLGKYMLNLSFSVQTFFSTD